MASGYKQTVFGLLRKHRELLVEIADASAALTAKQSALDAIEAALRVFDPTLVPATEYHRRGANIVNGMHRFILDTLREDGAVTTLGAAAALLKARGQDHRDRALLTARVARRMGHEPRVTFLSYSVVRFVGMNDGAGDDVSLDQRHASGLVLRGER